MVQRVPEIERLVQSQLSISATGLDSISIERIAPIERQARTGQRVRSAEQLVH